MMEKRRVNGWKACEAKGCKAAAIPGRIICEGHAYPAEIKVSGRRQAIEAQKKAKALAKAAEEKGQTGD
jgi:hypothetical protein